MMTMRLQQPNSVQGASASMQGGAATVTVYFSDIEEAQEFAAKINRNVGEKYQQDLDGSEFLGHYADAHEAEIKTIDRDQET